MGANESQEARPEEPTADVDEENFDLDEIPDDRDPADVSSQPLTTPENRMPTTQAESQLSNRRKRRKKRKTRQDYNDSSNDEPTIAVPEQVQPLSQSPPENSQLMEIEPETFHIYASSDDSDAAEAPGWDGDHKVRESIEDKKQEARERASPDTTDHSSPSDQDEPTTPPKSPEAVDMKRSPLSKHQSPGNANLKSSGTHESDVEPQISNGFTAVNEMSQPEVELQANTTLDPPSLIKRDGRWLCPFAEEYHCSKTFSVLKGAKRHAQSHVKTFTCAVCNKSFGRNDTLTRHMEQHDGLELAVAEAGEEDEPLQVEPEVESGAPENQSGMEEDNPVEYTTPLEPSQFEVAEEEEESQLRIYEDGESVEAGDGIEEHQADVEEAQEIIPAQQAISERPASLDLEDRSFEDRIRETPVATQGQKRKRRVQTSNPTEDTPKARKRRKETAMSSSRLLPSSANSATNVEAQQVTEKIVPQLQLRRQSSIEGWAQPYKLGLKLRHPIPNPKPPSKQMQQIVEVLIPSTSQAGPSSHDLNKSLTRKKVIRKQRDQDSDGGPVNAPFHSTSIRSSSYTTTNGKGRAVAGIDYSSPSKSHAVLSSSRQPSGIATSVAKRTFPTTPADRVNGDSGSDYSGDSAATSGDEMSDTEHTLRTIMNKNFECETCHTKFGSKKALKNHLENPNVHLLKCRTCSKKFVSKPALARHESETGHGKSHGSKGAGQVGQVGAFDTHEVQKLNNWKDRFCEENNITGAQFNDMMTATTQRRKSESWTCVFITRQEFLDQFFSVLPDRNRRSMLRYRERNFQNLEGSLNWTKDDDRELIRLVKEMGTRWSKIAKIMMRTQDAVSQRWRHKLQYAKVESGEWTRSENSKLNKAVEEIRRQSGVTADAKEWTIPWVQVSEKMKTRTPQQCSNHWRALHGTKKDGRWIPVSGLEKTPGASRILAPSKMQKRLAGTGLGSGKRSPLSSKYVKDDDTGSENMSEEPAVPGKREARLSKPVEIESNSQVSENGTTETPHVSRRLLTKKTPGKTLGSSQLFEQTQVNTSALKLPQSGSKRPTSYQAQSQSQERPSPNISIQRRAISRSPLQEITSLRNGGVDRAENDSTGDVEVEYDVNDHVEIQETEVEKSEAEDDAMADESEIEDETSSEGTGSDVDETNKTDLLLGQESDETSEEDSDDEDKDEDEDEESGDEDTKDESEEEQQSSVNDESFDFMNSINEVAQRVKSSQVKLTNGRILGSKRKAHIVQDESGDEDTESE